MCNQALVFLFLKSKLFVSFKFRAFRMASHFEEERFSLGEKSERMVTVTSLMRKLKVHVRQFYVNGNGEIKPGKSGIVLEIEEFLEYFYDRCYCKSQPGLVKHRYNVKN